MVSRRSGFTLVELVTVIGIAGLLALAVAPRLFDRVGFEARGFHDQARSVIRYAQKVAVAQRRTVFVQVTAGGVAACYDAGCGNPVGDPSQGGSLAIVAPAGVTLTSTAANFSFNGLGRPSEVGTVTINLIGDVTPRAIVVQPETGYVF